MRDIVYACNNNYIEQTTISMVTLLKTNSYPIKFWIVSDCIAEESKQLMLEKTCKFERELVFLDINNVLCNVLLEDGGRHPKTIYAKLFLETIINSDRVLYLDSDTVINGSLEELWTKSMEQVLIAGVQMPYSAKVKAEMGIRPKNPYLCDGMVMINLQMWRTMHISEQCKVHIIAHHGKPPMLSEGTLNYVCQDYTELLDPRYNLMPSMILYNANQIIRLFKAKTYYSEQELEDARRNPVIIHYINELYNRPWLEPCDHPYRQLYRQERDELFGNSAYEFKNISRKTRLTRILKDLLPFSLYAGMYHIKHKGI